MTEFPLSAIVGQEALIEALLVNAVAPDVGGVLVRGERGTAKSTAVRALAPLLPAVRAATSQAYAFGPGELAPDGAVALDAPTVARAARLVELPLGTTLDRLVGSLDLGRALAGEQAFEAGLLARAHRGILYVDEVNLLPDHLVDALLDAAATGVARVEREAVSVVHAARFLLVGTMNAEEGELRPQLLDRFGLGVEVRAPRGPSQRAEIVRRRLAFERDPVAFSGAWASGEDALAARIAEARGRLDGVRLPERELLRITGACAALGIDGVRGDIVTAQAARALAALDGCDEVAEQHVRRAAALALAHRRRRDPLDGREPDADELQRALDGEDEPPDGGGANGAGSGAGPREGREPSGGVPASAASGAGVSAGAGAAGAGAAGAGAGAGRADAAGGAAAAEGAAAAAGAAHTTGAAGPVGQGVVNGHARERRDAPQRAALPLDVLVLARTGSGPAGRSARTRGPGAGAIDSRPARGGEDVAIVASLHARLLERAVPGGEAAGRPAPAFHPGAMPGGAAAGRPAQAFHASTPPAPLREHVRAGRESTLVCLVVDASGSMGARRRLARVKGALVALLRDAYARRDRVAVIAFRDAAAQLLVAPGAPLALAAAALRELPAGGRTPLAAGLDAAERLIRREALREPDRRAIAIVLTDGRVADPRGEIPLAAARLGRAAAAVHVVDTEDGPVRLGLATALAGAAGGEVHRLVPAPTRSAA
ncbi:MAG: magnesium chelatase subunit [Solirubrobacteraceae bacterium]|nr:magnesium chelatase subunit [Solirubrobacteraceae bacterium]